jgi:hypothetical protein
MPFRAGADLGDPTGIGLDDADRIQAAGVDDHAIVDLSLAEKRMPLSAHRHLDPVTVRVLDELGDVLCIDGRSTATGFLCTT